ncbi:PITH domain-containing protein GA19395-like isoform X2 [Dreissena polymorpha]|uniref:PITH domain-containing protein GA19395-like isoform X2 n=1 Tax=Dreissena polymorpha TaxID=45954 RepID=UPI0022652121|nr:PITH domain-containing protein GA19395-like isoform X2 [Dreissena polymorpha]XP_052283070.1 PITH domain-containing protein GA19395-like isoform X2 [Dreissena polymorpha]
MSGHGHSHSHGGCSGHDHDHVSEADQAAAYSLYLKIDTERVQCLNESVEGSAKCVFKPWDQRLDKEKFVESDCDEELLFNIPFKNRPNMTFDDAASAADQEFDLRPDPSGVLEYSTKVTRFNQCESISLHFPTNFGAETSKVYYIGLKGDFSEAHRHEVTICSYETTPNISDHKTTLLDSVNHFIQ